ncbi:hypothetical protein [Sphingobacterium multivorum]|uniref:hypothetical protein n=1 Tax=Sphingobacterium multivorum TaxID=28454 RepID=UPI003DA56D86
MKRILFVLFTFGVLGIARGQDIEKKQIVVSPHGITFGNDDTTIVIESGKPQKETVSTIIKNLKTKHLSKNLRIDTIDNAIIINDYIPGFTKSDKTAGSAYLLDLTYKIAIDVKDDRFRINAPSVKISANQKYESDAVTFNKGVQFTVEMGIKGKRDVWNKKAKTMFIYDEKDKLIEKGTKDKLEKELSSIINTITNQSSNLTW